MSDDREGEEDDIRSPPSSSYSSAPPSDPHEDWKHFVNFELFFDRYWPHFNSKLVKNLDCPLVSSEIIAVIKGTEAVLNTEKVCFLFLG